MKPWSGWLLPAVSAFFPLMSSGASPTEVRESFAVQATCPLSANISLCDVNSFYSVPDGKIAVIQYITGSCYFAAVTTANPVNIAQIQLGYTPPHSTAVVSYLPYQPAVSGIDSASYQQFGGGPITAYAAASTSVSIYIYLNTETNGSCTAEMNGYLVPEH